MGRPHLARPLPSARRAPQANYRFRHALIQDAAYDSLLKRRRQALHRRAAEILREQPEHAAAEPEAIAHHFTQAGLDDLAIEWWGRAGDEALRRSAFKEAISHLGKAIEMADKAGEASSQGARDAAVASQRSRWRSEYAIAMMSAKGFAAEETKAAFARAGELAGRTENAAEQFAAYWAQWARSHARAEYCLARETAEIFLREAQEGGYATEAGIARRNLGLTRLYQGDLTEARTLLERAVADYVSDRDAQARFRFSLAATACLAVATWHMGDVERAQQLAEQAVQSAAELGHVPTSALAYYYAMILAAARDDPPAALSSAEMLLALDRGHEMDFYVVAGECIAGWARGRLYDPKVDAQEMRQALAAYFNQGNKYHAPWYHGLLGEIEAATRGPDAALMLIDQGLAISQETGERLSDPYLHRLRAALLQKRDPENPAPAEEAFKTAIAIATAQGARSDQLLASLSLAKLYQSTARPAEAHAVLAPALEGFSPTPKMPEIAEAQALLATIA
jgi:tetratricopeptide (TPR) repeat protein